MFFSHIFLLTTIIFSHKLKSSSERVAFRQKQKVSVSPLSKGKNETNTLEVKMFKFYQDGLERVSLKGNDTSDPRDNEGRSFTLKVNGYVGNAEKVSKAEVRLELTWDDVSELIAGFKKAQKDTLQDYEDYMEFQKEEQAKEDAYSDQIDRTYDSIMDMALEAKLLSEEIKQ